MLKVSTFCSGIGSPEVAIKELGVEHEIVFSCEKDKYASQTYLANHTTNQMFDDMTTMDMSQERLYSDLCVAGIPCQAFSLAGKRLGELDPRGLLFYNFYDYVKRQQPKYFIIENVKGLLSDNKGKTFDNWIALLSKSVNGQEHIITHDDSLMYNIHWDVLNSKDFGVPQNRERVFVVGIRNDLPNDFKFPYGFPLTKRLRDILEPVVDEKYYLSDKMLAGFMNHNDKHSEKGNGFKFQPKDEENIASCVTARVHKMGVDDNYIEVKEATKKGFDIAQEGDSINLSNPDSTTPCGRVGKQIANTLDTSCNQAVVEPICVAMRGRNPENPSDRTTGANLEQTLEPNSQGITNTITSVQKDKIILLNSDVITKSRIRRLTPLECMRLQAFPDSFIKPCSDSQTYKQAGNSITTSVMKAIIKNLLHL